MVLNPLVSLFGRLVARSGRKRGNRQTNGRTDRRNDRPSTVTLAAHARRGLKIYIHKHRQVQFMLGEQLLLIMTCALQNSLLECLILMCELVKRPSVQWLPLNPVASIWDCIACKYYSVHSCRILF